jgi:archaeosortase A (PGF-CTERM-specific)
MRSLDEQLADPFVQKLAVAGAAPIVFVLVGMNAFPDQLRSVLAFIDPALLLLVFGSLGLLGAGYYARGANRHDLRIAGWLLFAAYWPTQAPHFFFEGDPVNAYFALFGPLFLDYIAYHEHLSRKWGEDPRPLKWMAGATFISAATYFVIYRLPPITEALIYSTTVQTTWVLQLIFGVPSTVVVAPSPDPEGRYHIFLEGGTDYAVTIILACTAIQSIMIFVAAIYCTENAAKKRKQFAYLAVVPVIYFLNLFRNALIVWGFKVQDTLPDWFVGFWGLFGVETGAVNSYARFEFMHSVVGKGGSLLALVLIALAVFMLLPELHSNILDIFDLPKRRGPGFFERPPKPPANGGALRAQAGAIIDAPAQRNDDPNASTR